MTGAYEIVEGSDQIRPVQFLSRGELEQLPVPFIRITTCGLLTVEAVAEMVSRDPPLARYVSLTPEQLRGRGTVPALMLLKLLLTRHERFATRDWLMEEFCHDGELFSSVRLDNIVSQLRGLLCPPSFPALRKQLVVHVRNSCGDGYQLAANPLVWVDQDALIWNVEQATRMERFGDQALPFWERAYELARRGPSLPGERYADWASLQRERVASLLRQSVLALARLYQAQHGVAGEEEAVLILRTYWQEHQREEDVLRLLMELLGRRECTHEALGYYERLCVLLQEDEREPDAQTRDVAQYLQNKQIQRSTSRNAEIEADGKHKRAVHPIAHPHHFSWQSTVPFSEMLPQGILQEGSKLEGTAPLTFDLSRRQFLQDVAGVAVSAAALPYVEAWQQLAHARGMAMPSPALHAPVLDYFAQTLALCRQLGKGKKHDIVLAGTLSASCLPIVTAFARQPSPQQTQAANVAAQWYRLYAILGYHTDNLVVAEGYAKQAVLYGQIAGIPDLLVSALVSQAQILYYAHHPEKASTKCLEAEQYLEGTTDAVRSYLYRIKAACLAQLAQEGPALRTLELAHEAFYHHPQTEEPFLYAAHDEFELLLWDGITRYHLAQYDEAQQSLQKAHPQNLSSALPERVRTGFLTYLVFAELRRPERQRDRDCCVTLWQEAAQSAVALQSELRYAEVTRAYNELLVAFPGERQIIRLREQLKRWN